MTTCETTPSAAAGSVGESLGQAAGSGYSSRYGTRVVSPKGTGTTGVYRPSIREVVGSRKPQENNRFNAYNTLASQRLLQRLAVNVDDLEVWTERLQIWLSRRIFEPLAQAIKQRRKGVWERVKLPGLSLTDVPKPKPAAATQGFGMQGGLFGGLGNAPKAKEFGLTVVSDEDRKRIALDMFLDVAGCTSPDYVEERIRELARGGCLSAYSWDASNRRSRGLDIPADGSNSHLDGWRSNYRRGQMPSDSQIIMHIFCTYMDLSLLPDYNSPSQRSFPRPFTTRYFVRIPDHPFQHKDLDMCIHQQSIAPPHFEVVHSTGQASRSVEEAYDVWPIIHGARNIFHALSLFIFCSKKRHNGFLGPIYIGSRSIDLLSILKVA